LEAFEGIEPNVQIEALEACEGFEANVQIAAIEGIAAIATIELRASGFLAVAVRAGGDYSPSSRGRRGKPWS
jgi:hypothetical protein